MDVPTPAEVKKALKDIGVLNKISTKYSSNPFGGQDRRQVIIHDFDPYVEGAISPEAIEKALPPCTILTIQPVKGISLITSGGSKEPNKWFFKDMRE